MTMLPVSVAELEAHQIELDDQGYDEHGSYWGAGQPLYWVTTEDGRHDCFVRADDAPRALLAALEELPIREAEHHLRQADAASDMSLEPIHRNDGSYGVPDIVEASHVSAPRADAAVGSAPAEPSRPADEAFAKGPTDQAGPT